MNIKDRLFKIVSEELRIPLNGEMINLEINQTEAWDSLGHLTLILAVENEFKIKFSTSQIMEIFSVKKILQAVEAKINENS